MRLASQIHDAGGGAGGGGGAGAAPGALYRGGEGMWSWVAHRITGVSVFFFLLVHVLDTALVRVSPEAYDLVIATYKTPIVNLSRSAWSARSSTTRSTASGSSSSTSGPRGRATSGR
jgi:hypothetical protein